MNTKEVAENLVEVLSDPARHWNEGISHKDVAEVAQAYLDLLDENQVVKCPKCGERFQVDNEGGKTPL